MKKLLLGLCACIALTGCQSSVSYSAEEPVREDNKPAVVRDRADGRRLYTDGVYVSEGRGMQGDIRVEVRVRDGYVDAVRVLEHVENVGVVEDAFDRLEQEVLDKQSAEVDVVSGATEASYGYLEAVRNCLRQAE